MYGKINDRNRQDVLFYFMLKSSAECKCIHRQIIRSQNSLQWNVWPTHFWITFVLHEIIDLYMIHALYVIAIIQMIQLFMLCR